MICHPTWLRHEISLVKGPGSNLPLNCACHNCHSGRKSVDFPSHRLTVQRSPTSAAAATFSEWSAAIFFKRTVCSAQIKYLIWDFTGCGIFSGLWTQNQRFNPTRWVDFFAKNMMKFSQQFYIGCMQLVLNRKLRMQFIDS